MTDAAWIAFLEDDDEKVSRKNRAEKRRHKSLNDLSDYSRYLQDATVDVKADALLIVEAGDLHSALARLPDDERELVQRLKLDNPPISVEDYAKEKGLTQDAVWQRTARITAKLNKMLNKNIP